MVGKTLFLTGGMPHESKQRRISRAKSDSVTRSVHIVGQDFNDEDDKVATRLLSDLFWAGDREWRTIKLHSCRGKRMGRIVRAVTKASTRRLVIQSPFNEDAKNFMPELCRGLSQSSTNMLTLCLHDIHLNEACVRLLSKGLETNKHLAELSFDSSKFTGDGVIESLGTCLKAWSSGEHLSFQHCQMTDISCGKIASALEGHRSLMELCLDGNSCKEVALGQLGRILPSTRLLVLDLASQKLEEDDQMELDTFSAGLAKSRVNCLHLNGNPLNDCNLRSLSSGLKMCMSLRRLELAWCDLSDPSSMSELSFALCHNSVLSTLILYDCGISDEGIACFASRMHMMTSLKKLDIGGKQGFGVYGREALIAGLEKSTEIEEVNLSRCAQSNRLQFFCDVNKGGRRYLKSHDVSPSGLASLVLERVWKVELSSSFDDDDESLVAEDESGESISPSKCWPPPSDLERRLGILYHLVRNIPVLSTR